MQWRLVIDKSKPFALCFSCLYCTRNFALFTVKMFTQSYLLTPSTRPHNGASANEWVTNVWMMCCLGHVISPQK